MLIGYASVWLKFVNERGERANIPFLITLYVTGFRLVLKRNLILETFCCSNMLTLLDV